MRRYYEARTVKLMRPLWVFWTCLAVRKRATSVVKETQKDVKKFIAKSGVAFPVRPAVKAWLLSNYVAWWNHLICWAHLETVRKAWYGESELVQKLNTNITKKLCAQADVFNRELVEVSQSPKMYRFRYHYCGFKFLCPRCWIRKVAMPVLERVSDYFAFSKETTPLGKSSNKHHLVACYFVSSKALLTSPSLARKRKRYAAAFKKQTRQLVSQLFPNNLGYVVLNLPKVHRYQLRHAVRLKRLFLIVMVEKDLKALPKVLSYTLEKSKHMRLHYKVLTKRRNGTRASARTMSKRLAKLLQFPGTKLREDDLVRATYLFESSSTIESSGVLSGPWLHERWRLAKNSGRFFTNKYFGPRKSRDSILRKLKLLPEIESETVQHE